MNRRKLYKKTIVDYRKVTESVFVLAFEKDFDFEPGQVVAIDVEPEGKPRLYSIASGVNDKNVEIIFDEKPDGKLTPFLSKLNIGDVIYVSKPFGLFRCDDDEAWWIASGTGVAPFVSMIRSGKGKGKILLHGGRRDENFYFSEVVENELEAGNYVRCTSRQPDTRYYNGRLTSWLREQELLPKEIKYYLCGSAEMVVEVRDILLNRGIPFGNIVSETYF
ncbi:MAG: oxidoreductase [Porphyromonadaceae bacterium]|nr:oxidoreductase [Porphyromonadaceae bacterium]